MRCTTRCGRSATGREREKQAWREIFDYYVFGPADRAGEHLPEAARASAGADRRNLARQLRAMLIGKLNR